MVNNVWQLQEAKSKFSELVDRALSQGAQIVTRRGRKAVVVMPFEEYQRMIQRKERLTQFLMDSPLQGSDLFLERDKELPRSVEIEQ